MVTSGNRITVTHRSWFNETESDLQLYAGFNLVIHPTSGTFKDGNLLINYTTGCEYLFCAVEDAENYITQQLLVNGRCETIRVTVLGHQQLDEGFIKFHLFRDDSFFRFDLIDRVQIRVASK